MQKEKVIGIISNWDTIVADARTNIHDDFGESKDVQDILDLINYLKGSVSSNNPLREMLESHIADHENPHDFTLDIDEVDMYATMYEEYVSRYGTDISLVEFITATVAVKRFATRDDVDDDTNLGSAVNLDILEYSVEKHNTDPNAHGDLVRAQFPGTPITVPPSISIIPNIMSNSSLDISHSTVINVHDRDGRIREVEADKLPVDYSYGIATVPIFSRTVNRVLHSREPNISLTGLSLLPTSNLSVYTPVDDKVYHLLAESGVEEEHKLSLGVDIVPNVTSTFSLYFFPILKSKLMIKLLNAGGDVLFKSTFDTRGVTSVADTDPIVNPNDKVSTNILKLPNNWTRCSITALAATQTVVTAEVLILNDLGEESYLGNGLNLGGVWQFQLVDKASAAPPILTDASPVTMEPIQITKSVTAEFSQISGTFEIKAITPLAEIFGTPYCLGSLNDINGNPIIKMESDTFSGNALVITTMSDTSEILTEITSEPYDSADPQLVKQAVVGYTYGHQSYGFTDNRPHVFDYYGVNSNGGNVLTRDEDQEIFEEYFTNVAGEPPFTRTGVVFLQIASGAGTEVEDSPLPLENYPEDLLPANMMADECGHVEMGFNSITGTYLNGYLVDLLYYPVFATPMNIEFLLNQYIPEA